MATPTTWVNKQEYGPYNGVLIVFNIGKANYKTIPNMNEQYLSLVMSEVNSAHARGMSVLYLFDDEIPYSMPPDEFDFMEEFDHIRPSSMYGADLKFPLDYEARTTKMRKIAAEVFADTTFTFVSRQTRFIGHIHIDGDAVLMPRTV
jgi:hypothetical protein